MAVKSFSEEFGEEWVPAIAGAILLGPLGIALGLAASAAIVASGGDNPPLPSSDDPRKD